MGGYELLGIILFVALLFIAASISWNYSKSSSKSPHGSCEFCKYEKDGILVYIDKEGLNKERKLAKYCPLCGRKLNQ